MKINIFWRNSGEGFRKYSLNEIKIHSDTHKVQLNSKGFTLEQTFIELQSYFFIFALLFSQKA